MGIKHSSSLYYRKVVKTLTFVLVDHELQSFYRIYSETDNYIEGVIMSGWWAVTGYFKSEIHSLKIKRVPLKILFYFGKQLLVEHLNNSIFLM